MSAAGPSVALPKHRLEALCDGVFAVVMTLLVLELKLDQVPGKDSHAVAEALAEIKRPLLGYIAAFALTGIFWFLHHQMFLLLKRINGLIVWATLAFLLAVSLLPFSVSTMMRFPAAGPAAVLYFGNFGGVGLTLLTGWLYARRVGFVEENATTAIQLLTYRIAAMAVAGTIAAVLSYYSVGYAMAPFLIVLLIGRLIRQRIAARAAV